MVSLDPAWWTLIVPVLLLASVHVWYPWFEQRFVAHEDRWIGFVGGIATGYVVLYLLPKLGTLTQKVIGEVPDAWAFWHLGIYLLLLFGIVFYLTVEWLEYNDCGPRWINRGAKHLMHGAYSFLSGYVLAEVPARNLLADFLIAAILGMHLMGMNHLLRHAGAERFDRFRWLYAGAVLVGAAVAATTQFPTGVIKTLVALLAGMIIVNAMSEELPRQHRGRLPWYVLGVLGFVAVIAIVMMTPPETGG